MVVAKLKLRLANWIVAAERSVWTFAYLSRDEVREQSSSKIIVHSPMDNLKLNLNLLSPVSLEYLEYRLRRYFRRVAHERWIGRLISRAPVFRWTELLSRINNGLYSQFI